MAKTMAAFYDIPPWMQKMENLQRQLEAFTKPLSFIHDDALNAAKNMAAALDGPALRQANMLAQSCSPGMIKMIQQEQLLMSKLYPDGIMKTLQQEQALLSKIYSPDMMKMLQQQQQLLNDFAPLTELCSKIAGQMPSWTQAAFDTAVFQREDLWLAREQGVSRWADALDRISEIDVPYELEPDEIDELSDEEKQLLTAEASSIVADSRNWEQQFMASVKKYEEVHPFWAAVLKYLIFSIFLTYILNAGISKIGEAIRPTRMYEDTTPTSQVVYHIEQHQTVIIVDDSPRYYYVVETKGEDDEQVKRGYVSKRSIRITEETDDTDSPATVQP